MAYYITQNQEWYGEGPFASYDEAVAEGKQCYEGKAFFIGERGDFPGFEDDFVSTLLEQESERVYDECGSDASDNWPPSAHEIDETLRKQANEKVRAILLELCGEPTVFPITEVGHYEPEEQA